MIRGVRSLFARHDPGTEADPVRGFFLPMKVGDLSARLPMPSQAGYPLQRPRLSFTVCPVPRMLSEQKGQPMFIVYVTLSESEQQINLHEDASVDINRLKRIDLPSCD